LQPSGIKKNLKIRVFLIDEIWRNDYCKPEGKIYIRYNTPIGKEGAMNYEDKTKETLVRELAELHRRFRLLEEKLLKQNTDIKQNSTSNSQNANEKKVWRLPGYWY
jgi:hypothetical protein